MSGIYAHNRALVHRVGQDTSSVVLSPRLSLSTANGLIPLLLFLPTWGAQDAGGGLDQAIITPSI